MAVRALEPERIGRLRAAYVTQVSLAERVLDFANGFFSGAQIDTRDDDAVAVVLVSFQVKIIANLWAIIVLAERGLPTSSLARELLETVISIAYIAADDAAERARLYVDYLIVRDWKDMQARLTDPSSSDVVTPDQRATIEDGMAQLAARRGAEAVEHMKRGGTWAGCSLEEMARRAGIPGAIYNLAYRLDSRAAHGLDAGYHIRIRAGIIEATIPERIDQHLVTASSWTLMAHQIIGQKLGVNRQTEIDALHGELERLA